MNSSLECFPHEEKGYRLHEEKSLKDSKIYYFFYLLVTKAEVGNKPSEISKENLFWTSGSEE